MITIYSEVEGATDDLVLDRAFEDITEILRITCIHIGRGGKASIGSDRGFFVSVQGLTFMSNATLSSMETPPSASDNRPDRGVSCYPQSDDRIPANAAVCSHALDDLADDPDMHVKQRYGPGGKQVPGFWYGDQCVISLESDQATDSESLGLWTVYDAILDILSTCSRVGIGATGRFWAGVEARSGPSTDSSGSVVDSSATS